MSLSKGIDYYAFLSTSPFTVKFSIPDDDGKSSSTTNWSNTDQMLNGNFQLSTDDIGWFDWYGRFQWWAYMNGAQKMTQYASISPTTGNLDDDSDTTLGNMLNTPAAIDSNYALSYGFYDSGAGYGDLTNQDQSYVYLTDNYSNWMGDLKNAIPAISSKPFSTFALPAAHDSGMFSTTRLNQVLNDATMASILFGLLSPVIGLGLATLSQTVAERIIINFSFTQKETITTMLNLGVRYFDFRPGYGYPGMNDGNLYHQHAVIPGYAYSNFLNDVLNFLKSHSNEIVVVSCNFQGFSSDSMKPSVDTLNSYLSTAQQSTGTQNIVVGDKNDLNTTYGNLLTANKRLIFLNQVGASDDATKYDSYSSDAYQTTNVQNIINALNGMSSSNQSSYDYTVLQLQGTAQATVAGGASAVFSFSDASSPLMSTKAMFDHTTYPWLRSNVANKFLKNQLIVFLNDFADNALVSNAISITKARM